MYEDFEAGRKVESLERQIQTIDLEIRTARNPDVMRDSLLPILENAFQEYLPLAIKYNVDIRKTSELYKRAKGVADKEYFSEAVGF